MPLSSGLLITLEGIDGAGKTAVADALRSVFPHFVFTREPTSGAAGKLAVTSTDPVEQLFLFIADHASHLHSCVLPSLSQGKIVVSDRYIDSRAVYQSAIPGCDFSIERIYDMHRPWSRFPDLTILFRIDPSVAIQRCSARGNSSSFEKLALLSKVAINYDKIAEMFPHRFVIIDAEKSFSKVVHIVVNEIHRRNPRGQKVS